MYNLMNDTGKQEDTLKDYHFSDTCIEVVVAPQERSLQS